MSNVPDITYLKPHDVVPVDSWRMGIFVMSEQVYAQLPEQGRIDRVIQAAIQSGLNISAPSVRPMNMQLDFGGKPNFPYVAWVDNIVLDATPTNISMKAGMPVILSVQVAPETAQAYLKLFGGALEDEDTPIWATTDTWLAGGLWHTAAAAWADGNPSSEVLKERLATIDCTLFYSPSHGKGVAQLPKSGGLGFIFKVGSEPVTLGQVKDAIGARTILMDLKSVTESTYYDVLMKVAGWQDEHLKIASGLVDSATEVADSLTTGVDVLGSVIKFAPYILLGGGALYVASKAGLFKKLSSGRKSA